jgi:PPOX class probable F420-dependent enzyme
MRLQELRNDERSLAMASLTEAQRAFIRNPYYAVITTTRPDGSLQSTVVWVEEEDGDILFNTSVGRAKERNLKVNPEVSVMVVDPANPYHWVSASGKATLTTEGGKAMIDRLSNKYQGKDYPEEWMGPDEVRITGRLHPQRVDSTGFDS